jgi:hypothetical protein
MPMAEKKRICDIFLAALEDANAHTLYVKIEKIMKEEGLYEK